jgi:hypothetical protein
VADAEEEDATGEARDVMMTEAEIATTTATETETEVGALPTNDKSNPAQLRKVVRVDHCATGDGSRMQGRRSVLARATERERRYWDQPFGKRKKKKKKSLDSDTERKRPGG